MKKLLYVFLLWSIGVQAQNSEADNKTLIDIIRNNGLTPARVANAMDAINYSKVSIVGIYTATGTNTYAVTVGAGITNNDANKQIVVKFTNANSSSTVTLAVNGQSALPLKTNLGADPDVGGIPANSIYLIASTGTTWRMIGPTNAGGTLLTQWGDIPTGNLDDQTDLYDTLNTRARRWYTVKTVSSNYTASLGDENNKFIVVNGGADFEIPKDADVDFPDGSALLAADSLGTATFSKDAAVHMDTVDTHVWVKMGANKWATPRAATGGGGSALTDGSGTTANGSAVDLGGTLSDDANIDGDGNGFFFETITGSNDGGFYSTPTSTSLFSTNVVSGSTVTTSIEASAGIMAVSADNSTAGTHQQIFASKDHLRFRTGDNTVDGGLDRLKIMVNGAWQLGEADDPGTAGQVLTSNGASAEPTWEDPTGGGGTLTTSNFVFNEVPSGTVNGSNTAFTIANSPTAGTVQVYLNGLRMKNTVDYTISGTTITFTTAPTTGDLLITDYMK